MVYTKTSPVYTVPPELLPFPTVQLLTLPSGDPPCMPPFSPPNGSPSQSESHPWSHVAKINAKKTLPCTRLPTPTSSSAPTHAPVLSVPQRGVVVGPPITAAKRLHFGESTSPKHSISSYLPSKTPYVPTLTSPRLITSTSTKPSWLSSPVTPSSNPCQLTDGNT